MSDVISEISEDYDLDGDHEFRNAFGEDIDTLNSDVKEANQLDNDVRQLMDAAIAIESFGMNPTAFGILKATNLLNGTSLYTLGMENFAFEGPNGLESQMALESITDKIKEKTAIWSAKIVSFAKSMSEKVLGILSTMTNTITQTSRQLVQRAWDGAKSTGQMIRAHPFKTVIAVLTAAAAVAAIVAFVASGMPGDYANESALQSFVYKVKDMVGAIKWPFGKIDASIVPNGKTLVCQIGPMGDAAKAASGSASGMGWGPTAVRAIMGRISQVWSSLKTGITAVGMKVFAIVKKVDDKGGEMNKFVGDKVTSKTGSKMAGWATSKIVERAYMTALWAVVGVLYKLLENIVMKAFRMVSESFHALKPIAKPA